MRTRARKQAAVLVALLTIAGAVRQAPAQEPAGTQALWVAERDGVLKIASEDGRLLFELRDVADARAVAVDSDREVVWVYRPGELAQFGPDGSRRLSLDLAGETTASAALAVHPTDGSIWLGEGTTLQNIGYDGQRFRTIEIGAPVEALAIDAERSRLWAGDATGLTVLDAVTGTTAQAVVLTEPVRDLEVEPQTGAVWALAGDRLWRVDSPAAGPVAVTDLLAASSLALAEGGRLWVARNADVLHLDAEGRALWSQSPVSETEAVVDLVASADGQVLWAATRDRIVKLSGGGDVLTRLTFEPPLEVRSLALDRKVSTAQRFDLDGDYQPIDPEAVIFPDLRGGFSTVAVGPGILPAGAEVELRAPGGRVLRATTAAGTGRVMLRVEAGAGESLFLSARDPESGALFGTEVLLTRDRLGTLPPPSNPADLANAVDPSVPFNLHANVKFLWEGGGPSGEKVQEGVDPTFIKPYRAMVLRGRVFDAATQQPLDGVQVSAVEVAQYGTTQSRLPNGADDFGRYDFAVQGGGWVTLEYWKDGYLPVRRKRQLPRRRFAKLPDVYMTPLSQTLTPGLDSGLSQPQIAEGDENTDDDGTRKLRFFFPTGVTATQVLSDGSQQVLDNYTLRATEFTVGDSGPKAMPAPLPPNSGYTFAFEATITEAEAAGAETVTFDKEIAIYSENFLGIPICASNPPDPPPSPPCAQPIPVGYYDQAAAKWVPAADGMVVDKVGVDGSNRAELDVDGDGFAESSADL